MSGRYRVRALHKLRDHWGATEDCFLVQLHCEVVEAGARGGEAFQVTVVSPKQLAAELEDARVELGRGYLLARDYDERVITQALQRLVDGSGADTWSGLAAHIEKYFDWV